MDHRIASQAIARIYDCAIDAESWSPALEILRDTLGTPYSAVHLITCTPDTPEQRNPPEVAAMHTDWEPRWVHMLPVVMEAIPRIHVLKNAEMDEPVVHSELIGPELYYDSRFYTDWLEPQDLVDGCTTTVLRRDLQTAMVSLPVSKGSTRPDAEAVTFMRLLAPHFRRALLISDLLDVHRQRVRIMAEVLDSLAVPVALVSDGGKVEYVNTAADRLLSEGSCLTVKDGKLRTASESDAATFSAILARASTGDDSDLGLWGNGVVVSGRDGEHKVCYVLPLGQSELRNGLGRGLAAVFVSTSNTIPPNIEVLTAISGLTVAEASVALAIAKGNAPDQIAKERVTSVLTIRKQLASIYDKTGVSTQSGLGALVNSLASPVRTDPAIDS